MATRLSCSYSHLPAHRLFLHPLSYLYLFYPVYAVAASAITITRQGEPQRTDTVTNTNEQRTDYCILSTTLFSQARCRRTLDHLSHLSDTAHCAYSKDTCFKSYILEGVGNCQLIVQSVSINICGSSGMSIVQLIEVKLIFLETSSSDRYSYHT